MEDGSSTIKLHPAVHAIASMCKAYQIGIAARLESKSIGLDGNGPFSPDAVIGKYTFVTGTGEKITTEDYSMTFVWGALTYLRRKVGQPFKLLGQYDTEKSIFTVDSVKEIKCPF